MLVLSMNVKGRRMGNKSKAILKDRTEKWWVRKIKTREAKAKHRATYFRKRVTGKRGAKKPIEKQIFGSSKKL